MWRKWVAVKMSVTVDKLWQLNAVYLCIHYFRGHNMTTTDEIEISAVGKVGIVGDPSAQNPASPETLSVLTNVILSSDVNA